MAAAMALGLPTVLPTGAALRGGHALRRGGVQYLGASGVDIWRIQALARHSSSAVLGYLADSHRSQLSTVALEATLQRALDTVRLELHLLQASATAARAAYDATPASRGPPPDLQAQAPATPAADSAPPPGSPAQPPGD